MGAGTSTARGHPGDATSGSGPGRHDRRHQAGRFSRPHPKGPSHGTRDRLGDIGSAPAPSVPGAGLRPGAEDRRAERLRRVQRPGPRHRTLAQPDDRLLDAEGIQRPGPPVFNARVLGRAATVEEEQEDGMRGRDCELPRAAHARRERVGSSMHAVRA